MGLPATIRVKLSSEAAGYLSMTPVVVREMTLHELVESMLGVAGKDVARVKELLLRGTLVSGASRLRWDGFDADEAGIQALLDTFPEPDPTRPFAREHCVRAVLRGAGARIDIPREAGARKRLFRRKSFWDVLMDLAAASAPRYLEYSYKEQADCYLTEVSASAALELRRSAGTVGYSALANQVRSAVLDTIEFYVARPSAKTSSSAPMRL